VNYINILIFPTIRYYGLFKLGINHLESKGPYDGETTKDKDTEVWTKPKMSEAGWPRAWHTFRQVAGAC